MITKISRLVSKAWRAIKAIIKKPAKKPTEKPKKKLNVDQAISMTDYTTIKDLLGDLDVVFDSIGRMTKKASIASQKIIKEFGPYVGSLRGDSRDAVDSKNLESFKAYGLPSFLIFYSTPREEDDLEYCVCFWKMYKTPYYQAKNGWSIYGMDWVYQFEGKDYAERCGVMVNKKTGEVQAMPDLYTDWVELPSGKGYSKTTWKYPAIVTKGFSPKTTRERKEQIVQQFIIAYNLIMRREYSANIIVKNQSGCRATFTVPQDRWKYFFKERVKAKTPNGNTRRILHTVTSHYRNINGKRATVKTHFRGLREFIWKGYEILIVLPGLHGMSQAGLDISAIETKEGDHLPGTTIGAHEIGREANKLFEGRE